MRSQVGILWSAFDRYSKQVVQANQELVIGVTLTNCEKPADNYVPEGCCCTSLLIFIFKLRVMSVVTIFFLLTDCSWL